MDIVITYVDGNDPIWKKEYEKYTNVPVMEKRFRDWGTLKYLLRGIEVNMPFIRNVYLVVSNPSQVPEWVDQTNLRIVLHKDIIPAEHLPAFNSALIEMHLHRIEGLDEEYLYFNDDLFPLKECKSDDFFRSGKGVLGFSRHLWGAGMFRRICRNSDRYARKALGMPSSFVFLRPQHTCTPMFRSECIRLYSEIEDDIVSSLSMTRTGKNLSQYLFLDYQYYKGRIIPERISNKHYSVALATPGQLKAFIRNPTRKMMCVNDVRLSERRFKVLRETLIEAFELRFPSKSRFEK